LYAHLVICGQKIECYLLVGNKRSQVRGDLENHQIEVCGSNVKCGEGVAEWIMPEKGER
jgi:hypothetical protein